MTKSIHSCGRPAWAGWVLSVLVFVALLTAGCRPKATDTAAVQAAVEFTPAPPVAGANTVKLTLADAAGHPLRLGQIEVEGNMNHAGMQPVFARLEETGPGRYEGRIEFTMGGDWFLLVSGQTPDGRRFEKKIDVAGVKAQ